MMKHSAIRNLMAQALAACERYLGPLRSSSGPRQATVYQEMNLGAAVGSVACVFYACVTGAPTVLLLSATPLGFCVGSGIGLLLWNSSADLPEDPVLPPAPGQGRHVRPTARRPAAMLAPGMAPATKPVGRAGRQIR